MEQVKHPQSKSPINHVAGLWGFYSLLLTRLLSHSVKIGHIPIYIGIKFNFVLCELDVRWILSSHNDLPWWTIRTRLFFTIPFIFVNPIGSLLSLEILIGRPITRFPSMKKVSPSTAIPIDEETMSSSWPIGLIESQSVAHLSVGLRAEGLPVMTLITKLNIFI